MIDEYNQITAEHYSSYRPSLHEIILKKCISEKENIDIGLDIGCGTGQSSIALSKYCKKVIGIDPSNDMLSKTHTHSKVEYQNYDGANLKFKNNSFDIITFGGSLYYAKSQKLLDEVVKISKPSGIVVVYDFEFLSETILQKLGLASTEVSDYNHEEDFSGMENNSLKLDFKGKEKSDILINASDLAHLILSVKKQYSFFKDRFVKENPHQVLTEEIEKISGSNEFQIVFDIFYKRYQISK